MLKATEEDVRFAYRLLLGRKPDADGLAHFSQLFRGDGISTTEMAQCLLQSPEFRTANPTPDASGIISTTPPIPAQLPTSKPCSFSEIDSPSFRFWARQLNDLPRRPHRKLSEWCFISQALFERGALGEGSGGLGFAVGQEPLTALFSSRGCKIVATNLDHESAGKDGWVKGNRHAAGVEQLNGRKNCPPEVMRQNTSFRWVDMRAIPKDLLGYDFLWSSCAMEHLGSLRAEVEFVLPQ